MCELKLLQNKFLYDDAIHIFNEKRFFELHSSKSGGICFELEYKGKIIACLYAAESEITGEWKSPLRGTYGGISFDKKIKLKNLIWFLKAVQKELKKRKAKSLDIKLPPQSHDNIEFALQQYALYATDFRIVQSDINQSIVVDGELLNKMNRANTKRYNKCKTAGIIGTQLTLDNLERVYDTIAINRNSKGYTISMTLDELKRMVATFEERVILFGCNYLEEQVAAAICIKVSKEILYVFYWGDRPGYSNYSPIVELASKINRYCLSEGIKILDLGTSSIGKDPNNGLINFKRGLGCVESLKILMRAEL